MVDVHKHCPVCGTPVPLAETTCSSKCQQVLDEKAEKFNKNRKILYILFIVFIGVWAYMTFFNK